MTVRTFGTGDRENVYLDFFLIIDPGEIGAYNQRPSVRVTAGEPKLDRRERSMNLKVTLPAALFKTPTLSARIEVDSPTQQIVIDATAVAEAVRGVVGMDVDIQVNRGGAEHG